MKILWNCAFSGIYCDAAVIGSAKQQVYHVSLSRESGFDGREGVAEWISSSLQTEYSRIQHHADR